MDSRIRIEKSYDARPEWMKDPSRYIHVYPFSLNFDNTQQALRPDTDITILQTDLFPSTEHVSPGRLVNGNQNPFTAWFSRKNIPRFTLGQEKRFYVPRDELERSFSLAEVGKGDGYTSKVFRGWDSKFEEEVVFKFPNTGIREDYKSDPPKQVLEVTRLNAEIFFREARILANLTHPNIVRVKDLAAVMLQGGQVLPAIIMEDAGETLDPNRGISVHEALLITDQIGSALDYLSEHNIIHYDVQPKNIAYKNGVYKLIDFGMVQGSYRADDPNKLRKRDGLYSPLEQMLYANNPDIQISGALDQFSLGMTVSKLLGRNYDTLPAEAKNVIIKAISEKPEDRYKTCREFSEELRKAIGN